MSFGEQQFEKSPQEAPKTAPEKKEEIKAPEAEKVSEMKEKKEIILEEKAEAIRNFIQEGHKGELPQEREEFLLRLQPKELEKIIGKKELNVIYSDIVVADAMKKEITKSGPREEEIRQFIEEKGTLFLPERIRCAIVKLDRSGSILFNALNVSAMLGMEKMEPESETAKMLQLHKFYRSSGGLKKVRGTITEDLRRNLKLLREEIGEWQKYATFEQKKEEKPMKIKGFEKLLGYSRKKSGEVVRIAAEILPRETFSTNIKNIEYKNTIKPIEKEDYGFDSESAAVFDRDKIIFYRVSKYKKVDFLRWLPFTLAHEWGHSIDPRCATQKDLPPAEQFKMIREWERIRSEEEEWSSYVEKISNSDQELEELYKSRESLAESVAYFLDNPEDFAIFRPKRHEFCVNWLQKRFPEISFGGRFQRKRPKVLPDGYLIEGRIKEKK